MPWLNAVPCAKAGDAEITGYQPPDDYAEIRSELRKILPDVVGFAVLDPRPARPGVLYPVEAQAMTRAVEKRRNEFAAGRAAARLAMATVGLKPEAIAMRRDRAPVWPNGMVGSISHCDTCCVAVAARVGAVRAIGIDVEENTPLDPDLWTEICRPEELEWLATQPENRRGLMAKQIFSAKEAVYKAIWPLTGAHQGFQDVGIEIRDDAIVVRSGLPPGIGQPLTALRLTCRNTDHSGGWMVSIMFLVGSA